MTDIVERLRVHPSDNGGPSWSEMLLERADAASEIERLRAGGCARDQTTTQFCAEAAAMSKEIERLRAASPWQPIETAPKNKPLLVWHPGLGMGGWNVMALDDEGWRETANDGRRLKEGYEPTHWMPLPSPPIQEEGE